MKRIILFLLLGLFLSVNANAGRDGQTKTIDSTFVPPSFIEKEAETVPHLVHDKSY